MFAEEQPSLLVYRDKNDYTEINEKNDCSPDCSTHDVVSVVLYQTRESIQEEMLAFIHFGLE